MTMDGGSRSQVPDRRMIPMAGTTREKIQVSADKMVETVKRLIHEGNVRRLVVRQGDRTIMEIPLTIAAVGVLVAPLLAAIGALAAVAGDYTLEVERKKEQASPPFAVEQGSYPRVRAAISFSLSADRCRRRPRAAHARTSGR